MLTVCHSRAKSHEMHFRARAGTGAGVAFRGRARPRAQFPQVCPGSPPPPRWRVRPCLVGGPPRCPGSRFSPRPTLGGFESVARHGELPLHVAAPGLGDEPEAGEHLRRHHTRGHTPSVLRDGLQAARLGHGPERARHQLRGWRRRRRGRRRRGREGRDDHVLRRPRRFADQRARGRYRAHSQAGETGVAKTPAVRGEDRRHPLGRRRRGGGAVSLLFVPRAAERAGRRSAGGALPDILAEVHVQRHRPRQRQAPARARRERHVPRRRAR